MISAISTAALFGSLQANMGVSQTEIANDTAQTSSGKVATDLAGYGASAGQLTAMNSLSSRLSSYVTNTSALSDKLNAQDQALSTVGSAAQSARDAVAQAIADNTGGELMTSLEAQLSTAAGALNTQYDGQYLFAGGQSGTTPVAASTLSDLQAASPASAVFKNGSLKTTSRLDDATVVQTGVLASDVGGPLMSALQAVANYNSGPNGPLGDPLTDAQSSFLSGVLGQFDQATSTVTTATAENGVVSQEVTAANTRLTDQQTTIQGVVGNLTDVDEAAVATRLSLAQTTLQASAQIFSSLQDDSLLKVLGS